MGGDIASGESLAVDDTLFLVKPDEQGALFYLQNEALKFILSKFEQIGKLYA